MFFIKFLGKIENILGDASNIFNFTLEFNEKHFNPHFLFLLKTKKTVEKVFGRVTYSGNSYFINSRMHELHFVLCSPISTLYPYKNSYKHARHDHILIKNFLFKCLTFENWHISFIFLFRKL